MAAACLQGTKCSASACDMHSARAATSHVKAVLIVELQYGVEVLQLVQVVDVARAVRVVLVLPELVVAACVTELTLACFWKNSA